MLAVVSSSDCLSASRNELILPMKYSGFLRIKIGGKLVVPFREGPSKVWLILLQITHKLAFVISNAILGYCRAFSCFLPPSRLKHVLRMVRSYFPRLALFPPFSSNQNPTSTCQSVASVNVESVSTPV